MRVIKLLSANDTGKTGSHQSGLHIPRNSPLLVLLPLEIREKENPRVTVLLNSLDTKREYAAQLIYYNNLLRGGTRNEYRLTCVRELLKDSGAKIGDQIVFDLTNLQKVSVTLVKIGDVDENAPLPWTGAWKTIGEFH